VATAQECIRATGKIALQQHVGNAIVDRLLQFLKVEKDLFGHYCSLLFHYYLINVSLLSSAMVSYDRFRLFVASALSDRHRIEH